MYSGETTQYIFLINHDKRDIEIEIKCKKRQDEFLARNQHIDIMIHECLT